MEVNTQLPTWLIYLQALVPVFNGLATVVIGSCVAYIAWKQWQTARHKLKMELYDKRYYVYRTGRELYEALRTGYIKDTPSFEFSNFQPPLFLFDKKTAAEIAEFMSSAVHIVQTRARKIPSLEPSKEYVINITPDELADLSNKWQRCLDHFERDLSIANL